MQTSKSNGLGPEVRETLQSVRSTLRGYVLVQALLIIACWLLFTYWFGGMVDYLPVTFGSNESPRWLRGVWLALMILGVVWTVFFWCLPRLFARLPNRSLALLIERHFPQLDNELVTAVELNEPERLTSHALTGESTAELEVSDPAAYASMLDRVHASLRRDIQTVDPKALFNWQPVWAASLSVLLSLVITGMAWIAMPDWMGLWSQRLFALSSESWPRRAELRAEGVEVQLPAFSGQLAADRSLLPFVDNIARVPKGAAAQLQIVALAEGKEVPEVCTLFYRSDDGARGRANLRRIGTPQNGWQQFVLDGPPLDGINQDTWLDIVGLDSRLSDLQLEVIDPAVVTNVVLECEYPEYLQSLTSGTTDRRPYRSGITVPEGTAVKFVGSSNTSLQEVQYLLPSDSTGQAQGESIRSGTSGLEILKTTPADGSKGRNQFAIALGSLTDSQRVEIRLIDRFGLSSEQVPRYLIGIQQDTVPEVAYQLQGIGRAITPEAILPISATISDDHEIARVTLELIKGNEETSTTVTLPNPETTELTTEVDLAQLEESGQLSLAPGDSINLVVSASDFYDLGEEPHVGRGQPQQLAVVTIDELLVILDRQELEMRQRLEVIISELEQLRSVLQELSTDETTADGLRAMSSLSMVAWQEEANQDAEEEAEEAARAGRMLRLKAQQSVLQGDKSEQELFGVAAGVEDLRQQLVNNRIDSYDRQERLQVKVYEPLMALLQQDYLQFSASLEALQSAAMNGQAQLQARIAVASIDAVLLNLQQIKENMLDIESFNEIIDLVRGLLEDQDQLLDETEKAKRARILDLLN